MLAGSFEGAGYYLGDNYLVKNNSNPKGFFEDYEVNTINEDMLNEYIANYPEWFRKRFTPAHTFYRARWLSVLNGNKIITPDKKFEGRIQERLSKSPFCYKDPRFSYTLPAWLPYLSDDTVIFCAFREPQNTAESIVKECRDSEPLRNLKMDFKQALKVWKSMYGHILKHYEQTKNKFDWIFIHYNQLLDLSAFSELEEKTGAKLNTSFPEKSINRTQSDQNVDKRTQTLYSKLCILSKYE